MSPIIKKIIVVIVCVMTLYACDKQNIEKPNANTFDINQNAGWVHGHCLAIKNSTLKAGTNIALVPLSEKETLHHVVISSRMGADASEGCFALFDDRKNINHTEDRVFYALDRISDMENIIAIGVVVDGANIKMDKGRVISDINTDGVNESYTTCETSEGMNFYIWNGEPYKRMPLWTDYYYLGYDITPTCP